MLFRFGLDLFGHFHLARSHEGVLFCVHSQANHSMEEARGRLRLAAGKRMAATGPAATRLTPTNGLSARNAEASLTAVAGSKAGSTRRTASSGGSRDHPRLHRQQALALQLFAGELASAADGFRFLADPSLGRLFVMAAELHLAEDALALHLLLQHLESLVDIVVTNENLQAVLLFRSSG